MADSSVKNTSGLVTVTVYVEDKVVSCNFSLQSVYIYSEINRIGSATIVFQSGSVALQNIPESEDGTFMPGNEIRIEAGYSNDEAVLFEGLIINQEISIQPQENPCLIVHCRDFAFPATLSRKNRLFTAKTDTAALKTIWNDYTLTATVGSSDIEHSELVQYYSSDWDFTLARADANGWVVSTDKKKITVDEPTVSGSPVLTLTYGIDLLEFNGTLQGENQVADVKAWAWDCSQQKLVKVTAEKPTLNDQGEEEPDDWATDIGNSVYSLQAGNCLDESVLQAWVDARRLKSGLSRISGTCRCRGNKNVLPDSLVELKGVSKHFNGNIYVGSVQHDIQEGNWFTTIGMGLSPENITDKADVMAPSASGLLPGIQGLHIGKVSKLEEDPLLENRIEVELPLLNGEKNLVWARLAQGWASSKYGFFFLPDKGDEVIVGFFNNDPCQAVVLGSVYSSKQTPPYAFEDDNNIRAIYTRSKMKFEFDEENQIITLLTPEKNQIVIDDKNASIQLLDQHKNKIVMDKNGIKLDSAKDLVLNAAANIKMNAKTHIAAEAKSNVTLQGMNVETKASVALTLKGSAKAELSATGQTIVKGAMVMIN